MRVVVWPSRSAICSFGTPTSDSNDAHAWRSSLGRMTGILAVAQIAFKWRRTLDGDRTVPAVEANISRIYAKPVPREVLPPAGCGAR